MRCNALVLVLLATAGGVASAQTGPSPAPPPMDPVPPPPPSDPTPPEPTPPAPTPPPVETAPVQRTNEEAPVDRPAQISVALGIGYTTPVGSLESPNIASARLRLPSGLTFEPTARLSSSSHSEDDSVNETTDKVTTFGVSGLVRLPLVTHGKVDLEGLGALGFSTSKTNPEGDYNNTTTTNFQIGYGVAVTYWISHHWNFSMNVVNPIIDYRTTKQGLGVSGESDKTTDTTLGLVFEPDVFFMLHLYN